VWLGEFPSLFGWLGAGVTIGGVCWGMLQRSSK
jgi:drug/metabolite transporter (DMT)-like permease